MTETRKAKRKSRPKAESVLWFLEMLEGLGSAVSFPSVVRGGATAAMYFGRR